MMRTNNERPQERVRKRDGDSAAFSEQNSEHNNSTAQQTINL